MAYNAANGAFPQGLGSETDASSAMEQREQDDISRAIALSLLQNQSNGQSGGDSSDPLYDKIANGRKFKIEYKRNLILDIMKKKKPEDFCGAENIEAARSLNELVKSYYEGGKGAGMNGKLCATYILCRRRRRRARLSRRLQNGTGSCKDD